MTRSGASNRRSEHVEKPLVELELFVVEIDVREDLVLLEKEIGDEGRGRVFGARFDKATVALVEEIHLGAKRGAWFLVVEVGQKGIVLAIEDAARVEPFREDSRESGLADADRPFDDDVARGLEVRARHGRAIIAEASGARSEAHAGVTRSLTVRMPCGSGR